MYCMNFVDTSAYKNVKERNMFGTFDLNIVSSPEPKAHGDLILCQSSCRL